jgi:outer membrane receptor protein involved in Fe transport
MRKIFTLIVITLCNLTIYSQTISGVITDANNNEVLIGANIILENGGGTATDVFGKYMLKTEEGTQKITFKYIGYEDIVKEITIENGENKTINIALESSSEQLGTVVISAGRFEQKIEEITVSMEVIKPSLIENKNTTQIETAMDQIPGVNITDGQANIRGGSGWSYGAGTRVLVMVDDMPLISGDAGQALWSLIATENINQIEVIKGASSALYGSSALNGVINVRTAFPSQKDIDKDPNKKGFLKVNMHSGVYDFPKREALNWNGEKRRAYKGYEFLFSNKVNGWDLSMGGNIFKDDGYRMGEVTDRKRFNINSTYKSKKIEGLSCGVNANFLFQSTGSAIIWSGLDQAYVPLDSAVTTTSGDTYNIDPSITYISGNNRHSLRTRYLKVINDNSTKGIDNGQDNQSETYYSDYQWQKNIEKYHLRITSGTTNERVYASSDLFNGKNYRTNYSLYTQLDKKWNRLNISLGARYESFKLHSVEKYFIDGDSINEITSSKPVFRTGLNYQLAEATYIRTSWGQGFRFPSMAELFISTNQNGLEIYPNSDLKPESGWSSEIGIKQGVKIGKWMGYIDLAGFLMQYDDMMEFTFGMWGQKGPGFKSVNVGETQISGIELSLTGQGKITRDVSINILAGYTYMSPISLDLESVYATDISGTGATYQNSSSDSRVLKYRYKHIAKFDAEIIYKKLSLGSSFRYNDFMQNIDKIFTSVLINGNYEDNPLRDDPALNGADDGNTPTYDSWEGLIPGINAAREKFKNGDLIIDLRAGYQMTKTARLGFIVNNLLNTEYMSRPANMMPPRTFAMQLALKI